MLIEFSIENFRSIRHRQTLSMAAAPRLSKKQNTINPKLKGDKLPALLKAAAIYGPNASGKSTLVKAFEVLVQLARRKPSAEQSPLPASPFRFDPELLTCPSRFEIHFIEAGIRYAFNISFTTERITEEKLTAYVKGVQQLLYSRQYEEGTDIYKFGLHFEGGRELHETWRKLTPPQLLFISQAVANSNEELQQLRHPLRWLSSLMIENEGFRDATAVSRRLIVDMPSIGDDIAELLSDVDVPIKKIWSKLLDTNSDEKSSSSSLNVPPKAKETLKAVFSRSDVKTTLTHTTTLGDADFDFDEESDGTKNLIGFALPWFIFRHSHQTSCGIFIVDEIDNSLHPKLVEVLVEKHLNGELPCQLIFTTHDTHLMDTKLLRRDQIWLTERDEFGATQLRSVHDFEGREGEDIEKRYFEGRYRALPVLRRG